MRKIIIISLNILLLTSLIFASEKKVLVEIFTNSHCVLCPAAHSTMDAYLQTPNLDKVEYIYYHMSFPYNDDQLNLFNPSDASDKNSYYGPFTSTPKAFFNGKLVTNSYSNWAANLDALTLEESPFTIDLAGNFSENLFTVEANVTQTLTTTESDFSINFVVVENLTYSGRNGVNNHKHVMRKIANPQVESFSINLNQSINLKSTFDNNVAWNTDNLKVIAFVQSKSTKEVFQSASISYSDFSITDINKVDQIKNEYNLSQNYPNPFNPTTTIKYSIPSKVKSQTSNVETFIRLIVFDILGREEATLVNEKQKPGEYSVQFNAGNLSNGIYFYSLKTNNFTATQKMILLK